MEELANETTNWPIELSLAGPERVSFRGQRAFALDPEVTVAKEYRFPFKQLDVYQAAVEHFNWCVRTIAEMNRPPFVVTNQILKAALSIIANIGEANGRWKRPGEAEQHYRYAQGSTYESASFLDVLSAMGAIDETAYNVQEEHLARIARMLTPLMRRAAHHRTEP